MEQLASLMSLGVHQKKEWGEILTGFETRNRYVISDDSGNTLFYAAENSGSTLARLFLKAWRPFTMTIFDSLEKTVLTLKRPFRWYFHEISVYGSQGECLGKIKKEFSFLRRKYSVFDASDTPVMQLFGPILHPWTFYILFNGQKAGRITKRWSGLAKEMFTDADNFGIEFFEHVDVPLKAVLLGAVFLIDFVHFENTSNND